MLNEITKETCQKIIDRCCETRKVVSQHSVSLVNPNDNNCTFLLEIATEANIYHFTVKRIPEYRRKTTKFEEIKAVKYEKVLLPKFIIDDKHLYLGFDARELFGYKQTKILDLSHIRIMLNTIAKYHTENLKSVSEKIVKKTEYDHKKSIKLLSALYSLYKPGADQKKFKEAAEKLAYIINKIPKSELIPSIGRLCENNVYFKYENEKPVDCKIIKVGSKKYGPLAYDVLPSIFCKTDEKIRQCHLQDLLDDYYHFLKDHINNLKTRLNLSDIFSKKDYHLHIKKLLPFVKLEMAFYYSQSLLPEDCFEGNDEEYIISKAAELFQTNEHYKKKVSHFLMGLDEYIKLPRFNREDCYVVMNHKLQTCDYELVNFDLVTRNRRAGLLGDIYSLVITINNKKQNDNDKNKCYSFFAKFIPVTDTSRVIAETGPFKKEDFFYNKLLEEYERYDIKKLLDFIPECYFSRINDAMILEDKSLDNYTMMIDTRKPFDEETLHLIIQNFAKLHASSLIFEELESKKLGKIFRMDQTYGYYFKEIFYQNEIKNDAFYMLDCAIRAILDYVIDKFPHICKDMDIEEFKEKAKTIYDLMCLKMKKSDHFRNAINHGDIWATNHLFKFDNNGKPIAECLIDFQLIRYCPPAHDLMSLFYLTTNKNTREKVMQNLIKEYYEQLSGHVKEYGCDIENIYTYETFIESCNYMKSQAVCQATLGSMITMCDPKKLQEFVSDQKKYDYNMKVDRREFVEEMIEDPVYACRFEELIGELYDICKNEL